MATVVALMRVSTSPQDSEMEHRGYDDEGNPIRVKAEITHLPGDFFEYDGPDFEQLLEMGAFRYPTEVEVALRNAGLSQSGGAA